MTLAAAAPTKPSTPMADTSDHTAGSLHSAHENLHAASKEHWRNLLEVFAELDADKPEPTNNGEGGTVPMNDTSAFTLQSNNNPHSPPRVIVGDDRRTSLASQVSFTTRGSVTGTIAGTIAGTVVTEANTVAQLEELNQDLEHTADNLADLEIEFAEDMQVLSMGLESAFEQWNASEADMMSTAASFLNKDIVPMGDDSIRSEFGTSMRSDAYGLGTSIRSVRQHARRLEHIKRDMEDTFRQTVKQQEVRRRSIAKGIDPTDNDFTKEPGLSVEESMVVDAKFNNWWGRVWGVIEVFVVRRRAQRLAARQLALEQQQALEKARLEQLEKGTQVKSFWKLFMEP